MFDRTFLQAFLYLLLNRDLVIITCGGITFLTIFLVILKVMKKWSE